MGLLLSDERPSMYLMTNTEAARTEARAKYTASRRKLAAFVTAQTGAKLDDEATIDFAGNIVLSGSVAECALVGAYFAQVLRVDGVIVEPHDENDPDFADWTCVRIPEAGLLAALTKHKR
jgi:hypothetical protein